MLELTWLGPVSVVASDLQYKSIMDCPYLIQLVAPCSLSPITRHSYLALLLLLLSSSPHLVGTCPRLQVLETISPYCMQQTSIPVKNVNPSTHKINKGQPEFSNECGRQHSSLIASPTIPQHLLDLLIFWPAALLNSSQSATDGCCQPALWIASRCCSPQLYPCFWPWAPSRGRSQEAYLGCGNN